jgi:micrococcal nuclease
MGNCICHQESNDVPAELQVIDLQMPDELYQASTDQNTPTVSFENMKKKIKVLRVLDGDTLDIALYHEDTRKIFKYRVRLYGIDTPEKKPLKSDPNRDKEMEASKKSSAAMQQKVDENQQMMYLLFHTPDKYGRLLGTLYDKKGVNMNQWMIEQGYATEYFGKTKKSFDQVLSERDQKIV